MLYRNIPKNGDALSILGFGLMRLPMTQDRQIDEDRATRQVLDAIGRGVNYLDTAWPYHAGESENFLGRALSGGYRDKVKIAAKPKKSARNDANMKHQIFLSRKSRRLLPRQQAKMLQTRLR